jgi:hypothetical protein
MKEPKKSMAKWSEKFNNYAKQAAAESTGRFSKLTTWSFSTYTQYLKCPFSVCLQNVQRIRMPEERSETMMRGSDAHLAAKEYVSTKVQPMLPQSLQVFQPELDALRKAKAMVEQEWAFNRNWQLTTWLANDVWVRMKVDAIKTTQKLISIIDYKTGRVYPDHKQQRSLYALGGLLLIKLGRLQYIDKKGKINNVSQDASVAAAHYYLDTTQRAEETFTSARLPMLKSEWETRTKEMLEDTNFNTITGTHCRWCKFRKSNGGPCPENM